MIVAPEVATGQELDVAAANRDGLQKVSSGHSNCRNLKGPAGSTAGLSLLSDRL